MKTVSPATRAELAPTGTLRVALNYSNFLLVSGCAPDHAGLAPDLGRELATRLGVAVEFVGYEDAGLAADAATTGAWDVAFIGAEPARAADITFTPAYVEIDATYLVPPDSPIRAPDEVDRPGIRIATTARAAYTLYLERTLRHASLRYAQGLQGAFDLFLREQLEVLAGLTARHLQEITQLPGARILERRFTAIQQAMGTPKPRTAAAAYLAAFGEEIKTSGLLAEVITRHGARGLKIAPLANA